MVGRTSSILETDSSCVCSVSQPRARSRAAAADAREQVEDIALYGVQEKWTYPDEGKGDCEDIALLKRRIQRLVSEARKYIGTNPTGRGSLWCGAFIDRKSVV